MFHSGTFGSLQARILHPRQVYLKGLMAMSIAALKRLSLALAGGLLLMFLVMGAPHTAKAQVCCSPPAPPPCCTPPAPPPCCTPPPPPCNCTPTPPCCSPGNRTNIIVNNTSVAVAVSGAGAAAGAVSYGGGGGGGGYAPPMASGIIQGLDVQGAQLKKKVSYQATRTRTLKVVIQAFCLDDRDVPHAASQTFPDRDVEEGFEGELYRCIAGTRLQYTYSEFTGQISFSGGKTVVCSKGEALWRQGGALSGPGPNGGPDRAGQLFCRPQLAARDCNERSLLRRFGAGVKVLSMTMIETYTAWREETSSESSTTSMTMSLDGGVGGTVY
jgi:hypothetical protein